MIYLYDDKGKVTAEYEDWKRRDIDLDMHNGSLTGRLLQAEDIRHYTFEAGEYRDKTVEEKYADGLITSKERDEELAKVAAAEKELAIQAELKILGEERLALKQ